MMSKCANPDCTAKLHYLRDGKIFRIELESPFLVGSPKPIPKVEHFWLCGICAQSCTVTYDNTRGVLVVPKSTDPHLHATAS